MASLLLDNRDFEEIYQRYLKDVFRYACRCVGRREVAEELAAEAFLELYRRLDSLANENVRAWLLTVVRNRACDYWRRAVLESRYSPPANGFSPSGTLWTLENLLSRCKALKPNHRLCLLLRFAHDMDRGEIARRTGLSENQVKGQIQYGLSLLRKELEA